ncbi:MAG: hypothetical protein COB02_02615 [Candidatus Cloacimonadota bacterium]|nr:MAG: hypothetical protein COB02_02615 [Candidatus Cloacimonadota bacterium]
MLQENELKVVDDVWKDFVREFESGDLVHDQILIVSDKLLLRGPNLDLVQQFKSSELLVN